jgi:predicted enzyme related to lactoylglutathione lyase
MPRVAGIRGIFLKAQNPHALAAWYDEHVHIHLNDEAGAAFVWSDDAEANAGMTTFSDFPEKNRYQGPERTNNALINYRVDDLDTVLAQLLAAGIPVDPRREDRAYGRFAWLNDPEGNRIELYQPLQQSSYKS